MSYLFLLFGIPEFEWWISKTTWRNPTGDCRKSVTFVSERIVTHWPTTNLTSKKFAFRIRTTIMMMRWKNYCHFFIRIFNERRNRSINHINQSIEGFFLPAVAVAHISHCAYNLFPLQSHLAESHRLENLFSRFSISAWFGWICRYWLRIRRSAQWVFSSSLPWSLSINCLID